MLYCRKYKIGSWQVIVAEWKEKESDWERYREIKNNNGRIEKEKIEI